MELQLNIAIKLQIALMFLLIDVIACVHSRLPFSESYTMVLWHDTWASNHYNFLTVAVDQPKKQQHWSVIQTVQIQQHCAQMRFLWNAVTKPAILNAENAEVNARLL